MERKGRGRRSARGRYRRRAGAHSERSRLPGTRCATAAHERQVRSLDTYDVRVTAPGNSETQGMIGAAELAALQPDRFVVNIGRGTVIDTAAIEAALRHHPRRRSRRAGPRAVAA